MECDWVVYKTVIPNYRYEPIGQVWASSEREALSKGKAAFPGEDVCSVTPGRWNGKKRDQNGNSKNQWC